MIPNADPYKGYTLSTPKICLYNTLKLISSKAVTREQLLQNASVFAGVMQCLFMSGMKTAAHVKQVLTRS